MENLDEKAGWYNTTSFDVEQMETVMDLSEEIRKRLRAVSIDSDLLKKILNGDFLLFPWTGCSAGKIATKQVKDESGKRETRNFADYAPFFEQRSFFKREGNPAWIAMVMNEAFEENGQPMQPLNTSQVLTAEFLASRTNGRPLRNYFKQKPRIDKETGAEIEQPVTERYWQTSDTFSGDWPLDKIIHGSAGKFDAVLTRSASYGGTKLEQARGIVIPA